MVGSNVTQKSGPAELIIIVTTSALSPSPSKQTRFPTFIRHLIESEAHPLVPLTSSQSGQRAKVGEWPQCALGETTQGPRVIWEQVRLCTRLCNLPFWGLFPQCLSLLTLWHL